MLGSGGGAGQGGKGIAARERVGCGAVRVALCILLFVLYIILIGIIDVTVHLICCSVKLPLSRPVSFCLFLSILLPTPVGGVATERPRGPLLPTMGQNHNREELNAGRRLFFQSLFS